MTIPIIAGQDATAPLNGPSPRPGNRRRGFEIMKMAAPSLSIL
jgi:hypothetical protein